MTMQILKAVLKTKAGWLLFVIFATMYAAAAFLVNTSLAKYVIDSIFSGSISTAKTAAAALGILFWMATGKGLQNYSIEMLNKKVLFELNNTFMNSLSRQSVRKLAAMGEGRVVTNFTHDINAAADLIKSGLDIFKILFNFIVTGIFMLFQNPYFGLIVLMMAPLTTILSQKIGKALAAINRKYLTENDNQTRIITRLLRGFELVKAYAAGKIIEKDFIRVSSNKYALDKKSVSYGSLYAFMIDLFMGLPYTLLWIISAFFFESLKLTGGIILQFQLLLHQITTPIVWLNGILVKYKQAKVSLERLDDILLPGEDGSGGGQPFPDPIQSLRFTDVSFTYRDHPVIGGLNLLLKGGKHYAIIGGNGSGKTTFIKLLLNLFSPASGSISANDIDYRALPFEDIRTDNKIVYIEDKPAALFDDFDKNIILDDEKDEDKFREVLKAVDLDDQYEEMSQKNADELSAGQKQRVSLARALYHLRMGTFLVMDEPFAALDANAVRKAYDTIKMYKNKYNLTIFEITHNLNCMERFDHIYYFEDGKIILDGDPDAMAEHEKYRQYVRTYIKDS